MTLHSGGSEECFRRNERVLESLERLIITQLRRGFSVHD